MEEGRGVDEHEVAARSERVEQVRERTRGYELAGVRRSKTKCQHAKRGRTVGNGEMSIAVRATDVTVAAEVELGERLV